MFYNEYFILKYSFYKYVIKSGLRSQGFNAYFIKVNKENTMLSKSNKNCIQYNYENILFQLKINICLYSTY
jgi:hypothetical protein